MTLKKSFLTFSFLFLTTLTLFSCATTTVDEEIGNEIEKLAGTEKSQTGKNNDYWDE